MPASTRFPARTRATVNQLLERHLEMLSVEQTTLDSYETFIRNHIRPLLGELPLSRIDGQTLDSFYKQLRTCRVHCRGKKFIQHRLTGDHGCDERCMPHVCRPLATGLLRKIQAILNGAGKRAVRWGWLGRNPFELSEPIAAARHDPQPPTAAPSPFPNRGRRPSRRRTALTGASPQTYAARSPPASSVPASSCPLSPT